MPLSHRVPLPASVMELEALATRRAAPFAKNMGYMNCFFEGDSITMMTAPFGNPIQDAQATAPHLLARVQS